MNINSSKVIINASLITNATLIKNKDDIVKGSFDFKNNPGLVLVLVACVFTGLWLIFLTFYYSRLFAAVVTRLLRKFYFKNDGYLEIGMYVISIINI